MRLVVVSPHLDDAVLSVGQLLAGHPTATVVTVCTQSPRTIRPPVLTEFDRRCGFDSSAEAMAARRQEDRRACSTLDVEWLHLHCRDSQYGADLDAKHVTGQITAALAQCGKPATKPDRIDDVTLLAPLGLGHPDHVTTRRAALDAGRRAKVPTFLYAELPYRVIEWGGFVTALDEVQDAHGLKLVETFLGTGDRSRKRLAVECYASQRWAIEPDHVMVPEVVWEVQR